MRKRNLQEVNWEEVMNIGSRVQEVSNRVSRGGGNVDDPRVMEDLAKYLIEQLYMAQDSETAGVVETNSSSFPYVPATFQSQYSTSTQNYYLSQNPALMPHFRSMTQIQAPMMPILHQPWNSIPVAKMVPDPNSTQISSSTTNSSISTMASPTHIGHHPIVGVRPDVNTKFRPYSKIINRSRRIRKCKVKSRDNSRSCAWCGATDTPEWRYGPDNSTLCNACGLQFRNKQKQESEDKKKNSILKLLN